MKKAIKDIFKKDYVRLALILYSFILVISLVVIQYAIFGSKEANATNILTSYGIWCRGSEVDTIPGYGELEVGSCRVPTDEDDRLNFDQCQDGSNIGQISYCDGVYDDNGACNGAETNVNFNADEQYNCSNLAEQYGKSIKIGVMCNATDTGNPFTLSEVTCQKPTATATSNFVVGNLDLEVDKSPDLENTASTNWVSSQICGGGCGSATTCSGDPGDGNMWSCYDPNFDGTYNCVSETANIVNIGYSGCYLECSTNTWEPCNCDYNYCVSECKKEHAGDPGTYNHYEQCGDHDNGNGCGQNYGCKCTITAEPSNTPTPTPSPTVTNTPTVSPTTPVNSSVRCVYKNAYEDDPRNGNGVYHLDNQITAGSTVLPGDQIVYYVLLENNSSGTVNNPYYMDEINPALFQYLEIVDWGTGCQFDGNDLRCDVTTLLSAGQQAGKAFTVRIKDNAPQGMFTNIAQIFGDGTYQDTCRVSLNISAEITDTPTPTVTITPTPGGMDKEISGRVYCQDDGEADYPVSGARVIVLEPDGGLIEVITDVNGNYSRFVGLDWMGGTNYSKDIEVYVYGFDVADDQVIDITGQSYADMTPPPALDTFAEYCADTSATQCVISGGLPTCSVASLSGSSSYTNCGVVQDGEYDNFDFRFRDCTPATVTLTPDPGIDVTKTVLYDDDSIYEVGETVTFGITIRNTGDVDLDVVEFRDEFNIDKLEFLSKIIDAERGIDITEVFMNTGGAINPATGVLAHPDLTLIAGIGDYLEIGGEIKLELEFKAIDKTYQTCNEIFIWSDDLLYDEDIVCIATEQIFPTLDL